MKVTVLITAYHTRPDYLAEAVHSALAQTETDLEVLVVDDGSTPPLGDILRQIDDPRLRYHRTEHRGLPFALIEGVNQARGRFLAILDHDDRLPPDSIAIRCRAIEQTEAGVVYGDLELIKPDGTPYGIQHFPDFPDHQSFVRACLVNPIGPLKHGTILFDRALALELGNYDPTLPIEYDLDLIVRLAMARGAYRCPAIVAQYRVHPDNFSRSFRYRLRQIRYRWKVLDKQESTAVRRYGDKAVTAATLLAKGLWQGVTHQRPRALLALLSGRRRPTRH